MGALNCHHNTTVMHQAYTKIKHENKYLVSGFIDNEKIQCSSVYLFFFFLPKTPSKIIHVNHKNIPVNWFVLKSAMIVPFWR